MDKNYIAHLFCDGGLTNAGVLQAITMGWITTQDAVDILGSDNSLGVIRAAKLQEISKACNATIVAGIDVPIGDRIDHFNLALEDQSNINNLFRVVELGGTEFPYQADDGSCAIYTASEIASIYIAAQTLITTQTAYHNALKEYVLSIENEEDIASIEYGMELPEPYSSSLAQKLAVAQEQMASILTKMHTA